jgi:acyl dehydratase
MLYAEDLAIGQRFPFRTYLIEQAEIIAFAERFDPLFIHIDPVAAANGPFGGIIASGLHTMAIYQRLVVEAMWSQVAGVAGRRIESEFQRPVRPGTVLTGHAEIAAVAHRPGRNDAVVTVRSQITDGTRPVLSVILDAVIYARPEHRQS